MEYFTIIYILLSNSVFSVNSAAVNDVVKAPQYCQWEPTAVGNYGLCLKRCIKKKGFIHSVRGQFLCSNEHETRGSPRPRESKTVEGLYDCECVHPDRRGMLCNPPILRLGVTKDKCSEICEQYDVLLYGHNDEVETYCEEASSIKLFDLEAVTVNVVKTKMKNNTRESYWSKICKCGINLDPELEKKLIANPKLEKKEKKYKPLAELDHLCTVGEFIVYHKQACENKCASAKAFFDSSNELICYHERRETDVISSENEDCQCGAIIGKNSKNKYKLPCNPTQPVEKIPASQCGIVCESLSAYIFKGNENRIVTYCDSRTDPPEGFDRLETQFKRFRRPSPSRRHELPCSCGVNTPSRWTKQNTNENSSTFEATRSKRNTRDLDSGETEFHVATDQRNLRNLYGNGSSSQPVTNPIITTNANRYASTFLTATNRVSSRNSIAINSSSGRITNQEITPKLSINAGSYLEARHEINKAHSFGDITYSGIIKKQRTARKLNSTFFEAASIRRNIPNLNEISTSKISNRNIRNSRDTSSTQSVENTKNMSDLNKNSSLFLTATKPNLLGSTNSPGVSTHRGAPPNLNSNTGCLQAATQQISRKRSSSSQTVRNPKITQNPNVCASSFGEVANREITPSNFLSTSNRLSERNLVKSPSSSLAIPNRRIAQNLEVCHSVSKYYIPNINNTREGADDMALEISDDSFVNSLAFISPINDLPEVQSIEEIPPIDDDIIESINDIIPVEDRDIPSQFGQLMESQSRTNSNSYTSDHTLSTSSRSSCINEGTGSCDSKITNNGDAFGDNILKNPASMNCTP